MSNFDPLFSEKEKNQISRIEPKSAKLNSAKISSAKISSLKVVYPGTKNSKNINFTNKKTADPAQVIDHQSIT